VPYTSLLLLQVVFTTAVYCYHITSIGRTDKIVPTIDCLMEFMKESGAESWAIAAGGWVGLYLVFTIVYLMHITIEIL